MRKVSNGAVKGTKNFQLAEADDSDWTWAIRSSWNGVLNGTGEMVLEHKLRTTAKAMRESSGACRESQIALEAGMHSPWVSRSLSELGHEVIVAPHPQGAFHQRAPIAGENYL